MQQQGVVTRKRSTAILQILNLTSTNKLHDALFLANFATLKLRDKLARPPGVGDVVIFGIGEYSMRIWLNPELMRQRSLVPRDIINAIQSQNVQAAVGRIGARPISSDQRLQLNIRTKGRLTSPKEFEAIIIRTNPDGSVLRLGDVARLELGAANMDRETRLNGGAASAIAIYQAPGANAIETLAAVRAKLTELQKRFPEDLEWKVTYDPTVFVTDTIHEVQKTLIEAFILVMLVVYLFLGSLRATLIPTPLL